MVSLAFHDRGIEVTAVGNGEAAVRRLPDLNPDLILADIFMPVRNGYELCEWVKKDAKYSHIPVILLVGAFDPLDEKEARRVGADGILKKPFIPPDPLIAMVTSVLEKASKVVVEIPKPKQAPAPPSAPLAAVQMAPVEIAPEIEGKTLPELPDTSADDASLAYGFGAGRRGLDDEGIEESAADRAPRLDSDKEAQEEFDGASTTNDWRRSAREFEIPEEAAQRHAFSQGIEPSLPSERDVPQQHIHSPDATEEFEPVTEQRESSDMPAAQPTPESHVVEMEHVATAEDSDEVLTVPVAASVAEESAPVLASATVESINFEDGTQEVPLAAAIGEPEPRSGSRGPHWMDLMASTLGQRSQRDWFSSAIAPPVTAETSHLDELTNRATGPELEELSARDVEELFCQESQTEPREPTTPMAHESAQPMGAEEQESFFADELETNTVSAVTGSTIDESEPVPPTELSALVNGTPGEQAVHVSELDPTVAEPVPAAPAERDPELLAEAACEPNLSQDPALIQPPTVHVTAEPLLIDESPQAPLIYGASEQEIPPVYSFLVGVPEQPASVQSEMQETLAKPVAAEETSAPAEMRDSPLEFSSSEFDDRMLTCPPSREALAEIPFLNPPRTFHPDSDGPRGVSGDGVTSANVDAVVQRILEKIEPQLRELLSQNLLKPLIATLVQNELEKKDS